MSEQNLPVIVVGDGWAALSAVALAVTKPEKPEVIWIAGAGSRVLAPLPSLESAPEAYGGVEALVEIATRLGIELGQEHTGNYLREFKNKAFREPVWTDAKHEGEAERKQAREESLWDPERNIANLFETRFDLSLAEIQDQIREKLTGENYPNLRRIEGNLLGGVRIEGKMLKAAILASGEEIACSQLVYADRWSALGKIQGLPKSLAFARSRDPHGILQATFTHTVPIGVGVLEGFFGTMNREAGEEFERHVWGCFSSDGSKSFWTIPISTEEVEDNHEIAKKLRRMKTTLDKMFVGSAWLPNAPNSTGTFMSTVRDEQVRFEESFLFAAGEPPTEVTALPGVSGIAFLTDGYGPSRAFQQAKFLLSPEVASVAEGEADLAPSPNA